MKTSLVIVFSTFIAISTISFSSGQSSRDPVLDIAGNMLRADTHYYILPVSHGLGGGLTLAATRPKRCPLDVVQENLDVRPGLPLTFASANSKFMGIGESTDLNIVFSAATTCVQSTGWALTEYEGERIVTTGGTRGNPGPKTIANWFKIEKYEDYYKLVYCPTVCDICRPICGDIGISFTPDGTRRLVLSDKPLRVVFRKADGSSSPILI